MVLRLLFRCHCKSFGFWDHWILLRITASRHPRLLSSSLFFGCWLLIRVSLNRYKAHRPPPQHLHVLFVGLLLLSLCGIQHKYFGSGGAWPSRCLLDDRHAVAIRTTIFQQEDESWGFKFRFSAEEEDSAVPRSRVFPCWLVYLSSTTYRFWEKMRLNGGVHQINSRDDADHVPGQQQRQGVKQANIQTYNKTEDANNSCNKSLATFFRW